MSHFNLRIAAKLPGMVVGLAILSSLAIGIVAYNKAASGLVDSADNMLSALNDARRNELGAYLQSIRQDVILLSGGGAVASMEHEFETAFADLGANSTETLKKHYIKDNPNPAGEKHKLDDARDGSEWSKAHAHHHPWLRQLVDLRGYYDVFLVSSKGDVVYSVYKEEDFATNLVNGPWKGSNIAKLFRTVAANPKAGPQFADFEPYAPSNNVPAAFIGAPLFDKEGVFKGALIFQMPIGHINKVMQTATGMGESGETYIVGTDLLMRSDSRFAKESTILKTKVETETAKEALAGKTGVRGILDYRGTPVLSAYGPLEFLGAKWAVVAEIDEAEVRGPVTEMRNFMFMVGALLAAAVAALGVLAARSIIKPLAAMTEVMQKLSGGDKSVEIPATANTDEIGDMARAVLVFKENMIKAEQLETEARAQLEKDMERSKKRELLTADFDTMIRRVIGRVNGSVQQVHVTSDAVHAAAEQTSRQSAAVSAAAEEASSNVQTVASAAEELGASTQEISRRVQDTTRITQEAVGGINEANTKMDSLANSANKIGEIINLINDIASQTNLLALNATIEAARAGDAGKGFAVVANEVKSLANQTAKATDEISQQIAEMQNSTQSALEATKKVAAVIGQANEVVSSIASAAEEQNAATQEIARNVAQASQGTSEVTVNISGVAQASVTTGEMAGKLFSVAEELEKVAQSVSKHVETFLASVKAA